jgi:hypothetical protein
MPIQLNYGISRARFREALELARSDKPLPQVWLERTKKVSDSPSKTYIAMLGTALLAMATDPKVDPFALKVRDFPTAYSARSLCKDVLVPCAVEAGIHIGTTGREPLNNQPFFRHERVGPDMKVKPYMRPHLDYLCQSLASMKKLDQAQAVDAFAAFLRVRLQEGPKSTAPLIVEQALGIPDLIGKSVRFISSDPENGKRGQALVAAALGLVFADVRTTRVYDPSRHWPGDVVAYDGDTVMLSVEVKQRPATETEILQFVERCTNIGVQRAMAALLDPDQPLLEVEELCDVAWQRHGLHLSVFMGADELLGNVLTWTPKPLANALTELPQLMATRLDELEASAEGQAAWAALFKANA